MKRRESDRAASIAISHALTFAITSMLITALLLSAGTLLQRQQEQAARQELRDIGSDLSSLISDLDNLNSTGEMVNATLEPTYPGTVAGDTYSVTLVPESGSLDTDASLYLNSSALDPPVRINVSTHTTMRKSAVHDGQPTIRLCSNPTATGTEHLITFGECS